MEDAAVGDLARTAGLEYSVVMKAVMDHADADKSDNFGKFAARASAECLLAFVEQHVPPRATRDDAILAPGTEDATVWRALSRKGAAAGPHLDKVFEGADPRAIRAGFTVLGRLSAEHEEVAGWIARVLARDVAGRAMEAFAAAKTVGERTAHAALGMELARALEREGTIELAERLEPELPHPSQTVSLREVGLWVLTKRLARLPEGSTQEERARILNNLSLWQGALGRREAALASTREAVDLHRELAQARPEAFLPNLAMSLDNLGNRQSELGQHEAALASTQEAVDLHRELAQARPEAFPPDLAMSLDNLGSRQSELGQHEAALASTQEAVDLHRKLAQARPEAFLPDLAMSLDNLGSRQSELGQHATALVSTQEAVDIRRKLAEARPDAFLPDLAMSLNNLGVDQSALRQREAALASTQEAVDIRRKLAEARPDAFLPDLAMSLDNLGSRQSELGQREAALASTQEAVDIRRKLAEARPEVFLPDLAMSLDNLGRRQSELGQREAALASAQGALDAIWPFFLRLPAAFGRGTSVVLGNLLKHMEGLGQAPSSDLLQRTSVLGARLGEAHVRTMLGDSVRALLIAGKAKLSLGKDAGLDDLQRALDLARGTGDDVLLAHAYLENANARFWRQDYEDARMYYLTAAALFQKHKLFARYALAYKLLVLLSLEVGRRDDAVRFFQSAEQVLVESGDAGALSDLQSVASKAEQRQRE